MKDIIHKEADRSRLLKPRTVLLLPEIKSIPRQSLTVRTFSGSWDLDIADNVATRTLTFSDLTDSFIDYQPESLQIESITIFGPRLPSGPWQTGGSSGDPPTAPDVRWTVPQYQLTFFGNWHTGTADDPQDQSLQEPTQKCYLTGFQTGRQKIAYVLNQRDKNFIFNIGRGPFALVSVTYPTVGNAASPDPSEGDITADVRMTRWGFGAEAKLNGDKVMDMVKRMAWVNQGSRFAAAHRKKAERQQRFRPK